MGQEQNTPKREAWKQISEKERYQIEALVNAGQTILGISKQLKRNKQTIQREIHRGTVTQLKDWEFINKYCADSGQRVHNERGANKGRGLKIGKCHRLAAYLEVKIVGEGYSPDAAIGRIAVEKLEFEETICTKTLYNYIDWGIFANISNKDLPIKRNKKKGHYQRVNRVALNNTKGLSIEERPDEVNDRTESGHWEMDCVVSGKGGRACLLVLTERASRVQLISKMEQKTQECVEKELNGLEKIHGSEFPKRFKSITTDNGHEFLATSRLEASSLEVDQKRTTIYYAHPYSAWERGSNEVNNKLIRRFIPKGADIGQYTVDDIARIQYWMNHYPRRMFGYLSAYERCQLQVV